MGSCVSADDAAKRFHRDRKSRRVCRLGKNTTRPTGKTSNLLGLKLAATTSTPVGEPQKACERVEVDCRVDKVSSTAMSPPPSSSLGNGTLDANSASPRVGRNANFHTEGDRVGSPQLVDSEQPRKHPRLPASNPLMLAQFRGTDSHPSDSVGPSRRSDESDHSQSTSLLTSVQSNELRRKSSSVSMSDKALVCAGPLQGEHAEPITSAAVPFCAQIARPVQQFPVSIRFGA